ncbi:MAG TPA: DUF1570 domain-containing protein [Tepidisphaeraceae bacterium]|jgi:hypothetical protein
MFRIFILVVLLSCALTSAAEYESKYYRVVSDLRRDQVKEALVRLDRAYEQFERDFSFVRSRERNPGLLRGVIYTNRTDYLQVRGSMSKSDGCYLPSKRMLLMYFHEGTEWPTVVHEAFHQYAEEIIGGGPWPAWLNEGTAEYYDHAGFTGDGYFPGAVSARQVAANAEMLRGKTFIRFDRLLAMGQAEWNRHFRHELYHESWSIVHYLMHGDADSRKTYEAFVQGVADSKNEKDVAAAWRAAVPDDRAFERAWRRYWTENNKDNTKLISQQRVALTTLSGIARLNASHGRQVRDLEQYFRLSQAKQLNLKDTPELWLPPDLLLTAATDRDRNAQWRLAYDANGKPTLTVQLKPTGTLEARYAGDPGQERPVVTHTP